MTPSRVSIIINHYRSPELLKVCLDNISKNVSVPHETFVIDGEADEEAVDFLNEDFPEVRYIPFKKNVGFAKLVNAGIQASTAPFLFILNADVVVTRGATEKLLAFMESRGNVGLCGPKLLGFDGSFQPSAFRFYTPYVIAARRTFLRKFRVGKEALRVFLLEDIQLHTVSEPIEVDWIMGSALFARRTALHQVGLLDERFFMYFEDVDWCRRFWEKGWKVMYCPQAVCYHYHKRVSKTKGGFFQILTNRYTRVHLASALKYFLKYGLKIPRYGV